MKLAKTLWLTAERDRAVEDGDPAAAYLLGIEGAEIDDAEAARLGLVGGSKAKAAPEETKAVQPAEDKAEEPPTRRRG